jgi:hypothetical protein
LEWTNKEILINFKVQMKFNHSNSIEFECLNSELNYPKILWKRRNGTIPKATGLGSTHMKLGRRAPWRLSSGDVAGAGERRRDEVGDRHYSELGRWGPDFDR